MEEASDLCLRIVTYTQVKRSIEKEKRLDGDMVVSLSL